jgi:hypothetical protein
MLLSVPGKKVYAKKAHGVLTSGKQRWQYLTVRPLWELPGSLSGRPGKP